MEKKCVVVLFGGQSSEHEVSCVSVQTIIKSLNTEKYELVLVGITKAGKWLLTDSLADIQDGSWIQKGEEVMISPNADKSELIILNETTYHTKKIDLVFPVLHGLYGEDGTVQGLLELAQIPYVGCGVLASAVSMDKIYTKGIVAELGIRQAAYVKVRRAELKQMEAVVKEIEATLPYPVFVKPSCAGSSCGVSRAVNQTELINSLKLAAEHDRKILVEEAIVGREIECAVLGGEEAKASGVGEILAASDNAFYDYDAKYNNAESKTVIDPDLPAETVAAIRTSAVQIFKAVDGFGLSRVDFFVEEGTGEIVFNEINTLPGFTPISMYPMLWAAQGIDQQQLVEQLMELAVVRYE